MREVLQSVLAAEAVARQSVAAARQEAEELLAAARREGEAVTGQAAESARVEAKRIVEAAVAGALQQKRELLDQAALALEASLLLDSERRESVVAAAVRCVCSARPD